VLDHSARIVSSRDRSAAMDEVPEMHQADGRTRTPPQRFSLSLAGGLHVLRFDLTEITSTAMFGMLNRTLSIRIPQTG
jgi:hypothetical protein